MPVAASDRVGTVVAGYRVERVLGRGGMSVVYRADDLRLKRKVALKLLAPELAEDDRFRERFLRESQLAASLDHPNVVPIYEAGEVERERLLYIAMRYVPGTDLRTVLRAEGALDPTRALELASQLARALDAAHERGLVHRDVKPSNVLLTGRAGKEHCYLADFGLSTSASDRSVATETAQVVGTIDYVAPEQIRGGEIDGRADVYSLACLLYECLTGVVPFRRPSDVAVLYAHLEDPVPRVSERAPLPPELDSVLGRGMAKRADDRWPTSGELVEAARAAFAGEPMSVPRRRRPRRRAVVVVVGGAIAAATLAALLLSGGGSTIARADSLVRLAPDGGRTGGGLVAAQPSAVTVCGGSVWVTTRSGTVFEIDPRTLHSHAVHVRGTPSDVANVGDLAAVVSGPPEQVTMVDAGFGQISDVVRLPGARIPATAVALGRDIWIADPTGHRLALVDPPYTAVSSAIPLPDAPRLVAAGEGALWAVSRRTLWRIDPGSKRIVRRLRLAFTPRGIDAGDGGVWLVDQRGDALVRIDPGTNRATATIRVGRAPAAVAVGANAVWVANRGDGTVSEINPRRNSVQRTVHVGAHPIDLVAGLGAVWIVRQH
jgi:YVTN family beta-propeller protein